MPSTPFILRSFLGVVIGLAVPGSAPAQGVPPPPPPPMTGAVELGGLSSQLAERVRFLGEDIAGDLGANPGTNHLLEDTQEMAQAVDDFRGVVATRTDPFQNSQAFSGIDATWQHLRAQLTRPGVSTAGVNRAIGRVDESVVAVRQAVNGNAPPPSYGVIGSAPVGIAETQRLANALVSRAQGLQVSLQSNLAGDPTAAAALADVAQLVVLTDQFHDTLGPNQAGDVLSRAFGPVDACSNQVRRFCTSGRVAPSVVQAWQSYAQVEGLIHQNLGLATPGNLPYPVVATGEAGPGPVAGLAQQLLAQTNTYIATFNTTARHEPEGQLALSDANRLLGSVEGFRQATLQGQDPGSLAYAFQEVDLLWQRLARRASRIARGRNGPYIQQVRAIGETVGQVHRMLGMIGPDPTLSFSTPVAGPNVPPPPPPGSFPIR